MASPSSDPTPLGRPFRPPTHFDRVAARARLGTPGRVTPGMARFFRWPFGPWLRLAHRPTLTGCEHLPTDRPYLLVANHSGGGSVEVACLASLWLERFGASRPLTAMAHPFGFRLPGIRWLLRGLGAIPATYEAPLAALAQGLPVLVFPGGDHEAFRPIWQAHRVDFAGRQGFLRIARRAWVPVVPLGIRGSHFTAPILWRSRLLPWLLVYPRLVGAKRLPVLLLPVVGALLIATLLAPTLGAGWAALLGLLWFLCPLTGVPFVPWTVRMKIGAPLEPEELFGERDESRPLDAPYARVEAAVQRLVSDLGRGATRDSPRPAAAPASALGR